MAEVRVQQGWLAGEKLETVTGDRSYYSFKGVPYAEPPLGKLRFKPPRPPLPWDGVREAKKHGPKCPHQDFLTNEFIIESEDCLYLNVYTPDLKPNSPLPVMFFIHGGAFKSGSGNIDEYGPDFLVSNDVILVTINYRLDALGFLCLDTADVPGNAGMKDQVAALKWVKYNIEQFGGDPNNITVFGESAGGSSTCLHVISPMSKGLFKRAISMSGVPLCDWSIPFLPQKRAFALGKLLGFDTKDPNKLLDFLQSLPLEKLINTNPCISSFEEANNNLLKFNYFTPVIEKDFGKERFLTEDPFTALKNGRINDIDLLIGYTNQEAIICIKMFEEHYLQFYKKYPEIVVPRKIMQKCPPGTVLELSDRIYDYYFEGKSISLDLMKEVVTFINYATFVYDILRFVMHLPRINKERRFFYRFSCISDRNVYGNQGLRYGIRGASHLDDLMYLFHPKKFNLKIDKNSKEHKLVQLVCKIFTNFAKYGNPTPDESLGVIWPEYDNTSKAYVDIGDNLVPGTALEAGAMQFWKSIYDQAGVEF